LYNACPANFKAGQTPGVDSWFNLLDG